jgi:hypothetical protein
MTPNPMELKALAIGSFLSAAGSLASLIAVGIVFIDKAAASFKLI